jgi:ABC-2 type transport system permease protein
MPLVLDTVRAHRVGALAWVLGGGLAMFGTAIALATEMEDFPGGAAALADSVMAGAEALRPLRWPAERLDTIGGYLTYHNVTLYTFALALYGVLQGARAIRGDEERGSMEEVLATGHPRMAVVRDRAIGFALVIAAICLGLGVAVAAGLAVGGEPDLGGSLITMGTSGLVALVAYALGMLAAQLVGSSRAAGGVAAAVLSVLYVATNMGERLGPAAGVRFVSPFHYANQSRALVPGYGLDLVASLVLLALALVILGLAGWAFTRRDYAAPLWVHRARGRPTRAVGQRAHVPRRMLGSVWSAMLRRNWVGLAIWTSGAAALTAMMASMQPAVLDMWEDFDFISAMTGGMGASSIEQAYWSFAGEMITPVIAAYVITQASGWVADLAGGRVELVLAAPVTWTGLVLGRLVAVIVEVTVIGLGALAGLAVGAAVVGSSLDAAGVARTIVGAALLGAALGAVASVAVAAVRRTAAVTVLAVIVGAMYLVSYLVPIFGWPEWLNRLSVFWAFGHPYLEWPTSGWVVLLVMALVGGACAAAIAERTPKVA